MGNLSLESKKFPTGDRSRPSTTSNLINTRSNNHKNLSSAGHMSRSSDDQQPYILRGGFKIPKIATNPP